VAGGPTVPIALGRCSVPVADGTPLRFSAVRHLPEIPGAGAGCTHRSHLRALGESTPRSGNDLSENVWRRIRGGATPARGIWRDDLRRYLAGETGPSQAPRPAWRRVLKMGQAAVRRAAALGDRERRRLFCRWRRSFSGTTRTCGTLRKRARGRWATRSGAGPSPAIQQFSSAAAMTPFFYCTYGTVFTDSDQGGQSEKRHGRRGRGRSVRWWGGTDFRLPRPAPVLDPLWSEGREDRGHGPVVTSCCSFSPK